MLPERSENLSVSFTLQNNLAIRTVKAKLFWTYRRTLMVFLEVARFFSAAFKTNGPKNPNVTNFFSISTK